MSLILSTLRFPAHLTSSAFFGPASRFQTQLLGCSCPSLALWPQWRSSFPAVSPSWCLRGTAGGCRRMSSTSSPPSPWLAPALTQAWGTRAASAGRPSYLWPRFLPLWLPRWCPPAVWCLTPSHLGGRPTHWWSMRTTGEAEQRGCLHCWDVSLGSTIFLGLFFLLVMGTWI